ncbi:MAG: exodeoxyribonuclease III [Gammaproteobacteria bacterium]|nr:MAG: exodeoxyribonuclease III [Gammaproteobacteria bacterium]
MNVITFNANGIRSARDKGFFDWLASQDADVVCIQETKAQEHQLTDAVFCPQGYHCFYNDAEKKGYSGTAIYTRQKPEKVHTTVGWEPMDNEGRWLQVDFPGLSVVSMYVPSGSASEERQARKLVFIEDLYQHLAALRRKRREFIICADWNMCHKEIDLKNWKGNLKNSGFTQEERAWLDRVYSELGYIDSFRLVNQQPDQYTWWSQRGQARAKNVGWRLDYQMITPGLEKAVKRAAIYTGERFSDHAPQIMEYDLQACGL